MTNYFKANKKFISATVAVAVIIATAILLGRAGYFQHKLTSNEFSGMITGVQYRVITMKGVYTVSQQTNTDPAVIREITASITPEAKIYKQSGNPFAGQAVKTSVTFDELTADIQQKKFVLAKIHASYDINFKSHVVPYEVVYTTDPHVPIQ